MEIDVAIPTYGGAAVIHKTLEKLSESIVNSPFKINRLVVDYRPKNDSTDALVEQWCDETNTELQLSTGTRTLPESREFLMGEIETDWFLFLDDDVYLRKDTLAAMHESIAPAVGGVQVRKACHEHDDNNDWSKWRTVRATTFATLIRTECIRDCSIPAEITQLEDEYIRKHVENEHNKVWTFNHQAVIDHDNQGRHEINYTEGRLAHKYNLLPFDYIYGNVPYNIINRGHPIKHTMRALGYSVSWLAQKV